MRSDWLDQVGLSDADEFMALVREHANVRGVLWGHVHQSLDSFIHGVRFMASPATCAQFLPGSDDFAIDNRPPGYRVLELMPDGAIADGSLLAGELRAKRRRVIAPRRCVSSRSAG